MPSPQQLYITQVTQALKHEYDADLKQHEAYFKRNNLNHRKEQGVTWYPIVITNEEVGTGDYIIVELERTQALNTSHQFGGGKMVSIFSQADTEAKPIKGTVKSVIHNRMRVALTIDDLPDWCKRGQMGVNLLFDESSYKEMFAALDLVYKADNNRLAELRDVIFGLNQPTFKINDYPIQVTNLNTSQNAAVNSCINANDVAIIHGPPGTGKTTTIVQAIRHILHNEKQLMVCCPSNTGVDLLVEKLAEQGVRVLRMGNPARISEEVLSNSLDYKVSRHQNFKDIKGLRKTADEYKRMAQKYKRNFGREEREQKHLLFVEARKCQTEAELLEDFIVNDELSKAQVIACTPVGSMHRLLRKKTFNTVVIDEAAQALEPMCWMVIAKANRVLMAGDHLQLPPTVKSTDSAVKILKETLFEKCIQQPQLSTLLDTQYRMHQDIMQFSNEQLYNNMLKADVTVKTTVLIPNDNLIYCHTPLSYIDTAGCGYEDAINKESLSLANRDEAHLLINYLSKLLEEYTAHTANENVLTVGIISPYKEQVNLLQTIIDEGKPFANYNIKLTVKTIDGFQGQERDIIAISLVRSNSEGEIGFLADIRRMNVAMTRAKQKLIVIGDSATIANHKFYNDFVEYTQRVNAYDSAWNYMEV
ncbi:MAG: AAA family ATPase [Bacteroidia bacterium]|nr:AAA family ATPase [Bacteroidia bacterium]